MRDVAVVVGGLVVVGIVVIMDGVVVIGVMVIMDVDVAIIVGVMVVVSVLVVVGVMVVMDGVVRDTPQAKAQLCRSASHRPGIFRDRTPAASREWACHRQREGESLAVLGLTKAQLD